MDESSPIHTTARQKHGKKKEDLLDESPHATSPFTQPEHHSTKHTTKKPSPSFDHPNPIPWKKAIVKHVKESTLHNFDDYSSSQNKDSPSHGDMDKAYSTPKRTITPFHENPSTQQNLNRSDDPFGEFHKCPYEKFGCKGHKDLGSDNIQSIHAMHAQILLTFIKENKKYSQSIC